MPGRRRSFRRRENRKTPAGGEAEALSPGPAKLEPIHLRKARAVFSSKGHGPPDVRWRTGAEKGARNEDAWAASRSGVRCGFHKLFFILEMFRR